MCHARDLLKPNFPKSPLLLFKTHRFIRSPIAILHIAAKSLVTGVGVLTIGRERVDMAIGIVKVGSEPEVGDVYVVGVLGKHAGATGGPLSLDCTGETSQPGDYRHPSISEQVGPTEPIRAIIGEVPV